MKMAMEMKMGEMQLPQTKLPTMKLVLDTTIKAISPEGDITYDMVMTEASIEEDPGVLPQVVEAMKSSLGSMKGLSGTGIISSRGINKGSDIKVPDGADPQMRQAVEQMKESFTRTAVPLPEEPVGLGAKWEAKMPIKSQGMVITQIANYELTSIEGERLTAKSTVTQTAADQKIENPAMPGLKIDLKKMTGNGNGEVNFDLARLLPVHGSVKFHSDMAMGMNAGGQAQAMDMKMDMDLTLESK
jgi:hypothetical protein